MSDLDDVRLPDNAFRELPPGETDLAASQATGEADS